MEAGSSEVKKCRQMFIMIESIVGSFELDSQIRFSNSLQIKRELAHILDSSFPFVSLEMTEPEIDIDVSVIDGLPDLSENVKSIP